MVKNIVFLIPIVLVAAAAFFLWPEKTEVQKPPQIIKISSSRKLFLGARSKSKHPQSSPVALSGNPDGCEAATSQLEDVDFNAPVGEWVERLDATAFGHCQLPEFSEKFAAIRTHCFEKFSEFDCTQDAIFLRALLRTRGVQEGSDRELLADLILREFANSNPDFKKLKTHAEKMLELDPDEASMQKLWASAKVVDRLSSGKSAMEVAEEISERVNEKLWDDPEMQGVKLAMATGLEPQNVEVYARGFLSQKSDPRMHEVLGWALWKQSKRPEAIAQLEKAIALNPKDQWLKDQLKAVNSGTATEESYQARISLGINLQDLYR